jgi:hypothetical protein
VNGRRPSPPSYFAFCNEGGAPPHPWHVSGHPTEQAARATLAHHLKDGHAALDFGVGEDTGDHNPRGEVGATR